MQVPKYSLHDRARQVAASTSDDFVELIKIAQFDPHRDLRFSNWSGISFRNLDLRGFDFTGSRLAGCDFTGALITGARFEAADIKGTDLRKARDWAAYVERWTPPKDPVGMRHLYVRAEFQDAPWAPRMVILPQGEFLMGSPEGEGNSDECPEHSVTLVAPFAVGVCPITRTEFAAFVRATGYSVEGDEDRFWRDPGLRQDDDHPVVLVSWDDAQFYVAWLKELSGGKEYRLLSEAEWEYCCRAGTTSAYSTGNSISPNQANFGRSRDGTTSVFKFPANAWGLRDMHGNVWEWCEDNWHDDYDGNEDRGGGPPTDGSVWRRKDSSSHVVRGGSWVNVPQILRSANRDQDWRGNRSDDIGFRVARTL